LEQEKKQTVGLKETIKRYESGADNLATQLEAEMRNQTNWKREKDRLDQRLKEVTRQHQEAIDREDALQAQLASQYDLIREFRAKVCDLEESLSSSEKQRKALEGRYESLNEQHRELTLNKQTMEKNCTTAELLLDETNNKLHDEQDANVIAGEQLKKTEQLLKVTQTELEAERKQSEQLNQEKTILEMQIKELQLKLLDSETSGNGISSRAALRRPSAAYHSIMAQIESESTEKQTLLKDTRRQERTIRDLTAQLADRDRQRISLEESLDKCELKLRKLITAVEAAEGRCGELEGARRRAERDREEEREKTERLVRECDRLRSRNFRASGEIGIGN
jgi:chromosome segregation ATPase